MPRVFVFFTTWIVAVFSMNAWANTTIERQCEKLWEKISAEAFESGDLKYEVLLADWQKQDSKCVGTLVFNARLAMLHALLNHPEKARSTLQPYLNTKSAYSYLIELAVLQADEAELRTRRFTEADIKHLRDKYSIFSNDIQKLPRAMASLVVYRVR